MDGRPVDHLPGISVWSRVAGHAVSRSSGPVPGGGSGWGCLGGLGEGGAVQGEGQSQGLAEQLGIFVG